MKETLKDYLNRGLIYCQIHPTLPLTIYNYTEKVQWEGLWDEVTMMCRGLVVDDEGTIVARPFKKFFNLSEGRTTVTNDYSIYTKYDGSLGIFFYFQDQWVFASRGSFTSEQAIKGRQLLDRQIDYSLLDKSNTYCFEIIYKDNKIVVSYGDFEGCILTGVFNTKTGIEGQLNHWLLPKAKIHRLDTPIEELSKVIKDTEEGYVIKFSNGERAKVKGAEYLRLHKMMSEMSTTAVWECLRAGTNILERLDSFPDEFYEEVKNYESKLKDDFIHFRQLVLDEYEKFKGIEDRKEFALSIKEQPYKGFFFNLRDNREITDQIWLNLKPEYKRL